MAFLDLFKKKKSLELELPPLPSKPLEEIPPIRPAELPEFPPIPEQQVEEEAPEEFVPQQSPRVVVHAPSVSEEAVPQLRVAPSELFVSVDDYRKIMQDTNFVRARLIETESSLRHLSELRAEEERVVERWSRELSEVERKLARIDHSIAKAQV